MLKIKYIEPVAETSVQRGVARALIDQVVRWGQTFDGSVLFQWDVSETPYTIWLKGSELVYDSNDEAFTGGTVTAIDLYVDGVLAGEVTGLQLDAVALQAYVDASLAAAGQLVKILNPLFNATPMRVIGSSGNDTLEGGNRSDVILGRGGDDLIIATKGNDRIDGGEGKDTVAFEDLSGFGGVTVDLAAGTATTLGGVNITLSNIECVAGTRNSDSLAGNDGGNCIYGLAGSDFIYGLGGADMLFGENGSDEIFGGVGNDILDGGNGNDLLLGGNGIDILMGGEGHDVLDGGSARDRLTAGGGRDVLNGGPGNDILRGGQGADKFLFQDDGSLFSSGFGYDTVEDFSAGDTGIVNRHSFGGYGDQKLFATAMPSSTGTGTIISYTKGRDGDILQQTLLNDVFAPDIVIEYTQHDITFFI